MSNNRFWILLARKTSGDITGEEKIELEQVLSEHPEYHLMLEMLEGVRSEFKLSISHVTKGKFIDEGWGKLKGRLSEEDMGERASYPEQEEQPGEAETVYPWMEEKESRFSVLRKWAAVILVLVMSGGGLWWWLRRPVSQPVKNIVAAAIENSKNTISTKRGSNSKIELPDGSTVMLYGGSKLTYSDGFSEGNRGVFLEGAAFFKIKKDADHPFMIQTAQIIIRVLGTEFNVRAYRKEKKTVTTLVRGLIEVELKHDQSRHIYLHPNERLTVMENGIQDLQSLKTNIKYFVTAVVPDTVSGIPEPVVEKTGTKLVFRNEAFGDLAKLMEQRYRVKIIFEDQELKKETLAGAFDRETLEQALSALQLTTPFGYEIHGDTVYLRK